MLEASVNNTCCSNERQKCCNDAIYGEVVKCDSLALHCNGVRHLELSHVPGQGGDWCIHDVATGC
jgi:hypothetical protein